MASINQLFDINKKKYGDPVAGRSASPFGLRPLQAIPEEEKDLEWYARNIDWLEWNGIVQLYNRTPKLLKNYKIAAGIMDKSDYIIPDDMEDDPEYKLLIDTLIRDYKDESPLELKFYPILPVIINVLADEFTKRDIEITYKAIDEWSINEILEEKRNKIEEVIREWLDKIVSEQMQQIQQNQQLDQNQLQQLQEQLYQQTISKFGNIENYINRNYRLNVERLVEKFHEYDKNRFKLKEKMYLLFKDFLITGMFCQEFRMQESDYDIVIWNPMFTFYKRHSHSPFLSDGEWVGKVELLSINEVISKYGKYIDTEIIETLQNKYFNTAGASAYPVERNSMDYFRHGVDTPESTSAINTGGVDFQRSMYWNYPFHNAQDIINKVFFSSEDAKGLWYPDLLRVTTVYWKTLKKVGIVTKIDPINKQKYTFIVDDGYKPVIQAEYDTRFTKSKTADNLLVGEHVEWFYIPYTVGGIKIGPNVPTFYNQNISGLPIYIGICDKEPGPMPFQFNNSDDLFSCKLPVEGYIYTERNTQSVSLVDLGKTYQIAYNIVNNQIMDMLLDEIGSFVLIDQNTIPKTSLEEDGGTNPLMMVYNYMKKYKILPIDTSMGNTGQPINFNQFQQMVIEHSPRIKTRIELAEFFKSKLYETIGLTPERLGRPTSEYQSGKASEINAIQSYSATEKYFKIIGDMFLPRFHEMRTHLLMWYLSNDKFNNTSITYFNDKYEREIINAIDRDELILRKFNVYPTSEISYKLVIDQIKAMIFNNPNLGIGLTEAIEIMNSNKYSDVVALVNKLEQKAQAQAQSQYEAEQEKAKAEHQQKLEEIELAAKYQNEMLDKKLVLERERLKNQLLQAQIRAAGYMASVDINKNMQSDFMDFLNDLSSNQDKLENIYDKYINTTEDKEIKSKLIEQKENEMALKERLKQIDLEIAKINAQDNRNKQ